MTGLDAFLWTVTFFLWLAAFGAAYFCWKVFRQ